MRVWSTQGIFAEIQVAGCVVRTKKAAVFAQMEKMYGKESRN